MKIVPLNLLLADDDEDDCDLFKDALEDLAVTASVATVNDGVQLMNFLVSNAGNLPDIIFLDLNMPRKSGFECLSEIKSSTVFSQLPVIIFSTSLDTEIVNLLYQKGGHYYIRKPGEYSKFRKVIADALTLTIQNNSVQPPRVEFVLQS